MLVGVDNLTEPRITWEIGLGHVCWVHQLRLRGRPTMGVNPWLGSYTVHMKKVSISSLPPACGWGMISCFKIPLPWIPHHEFWDKIRTSSLKCLFLGCLITATGKETETGMHITQRRMISHTADFPLTTVGGRWQWSQKPPSLHLQKITANCDAYLIKLPLDERGKGDTFFYRAGY